MQIFIITSSIIANTEQPRCPSIGEWIKKNVVYPDK